MAPINVLRIREALARWLVDKNVPCSVGNEHPTAIPTDVFPSKDGYVAVSAPSSRMWPKLCVALDRLEWAQRSEWSTRDGRCAYRAEIHAGIAEVTRTKPTEYWIETLNAAGVTCGPVYTIDQVFDDEQVKLLGMAAPVDHPVLGPLHLVASPMNFDGLPRRIRRPTPDGGADSDQILREIGYTDEKISELKEGGVC
jgi:crotonobetainyl-CoA:carnitine CoA-transferase CaiB-like acyl-CoA transferase